MTDEDILIDGYPIGSNITLMNTMYQFPYLNEEQRWMDDFLVIVYKDNRTGEKKHQFFFKPEYTFYHIAPGEVVPDHPLFFIEKEKVEPITVRYRNIDKKLAEMFNMQGFYRANVEDGNKKANRILRTDPSVFFCDVNVEDYYRFQFTKRYTNNIGTIHKAFYDIECDTRFMSGDFVESGECPINMISLHDDTYDVTVSFILRNPDNPLIQQFENEYVSGEFGQSQISEFVINNVGGWKKAKRLGVYDTKYTIYFFDDELDMIANFFHTVHELDPDFIMGWNSSAFDLQYFIDRIYKLEAQPADIMCNQSWEIKIVRNFIDKDHINEFAERGDYACISGNPVWMDQMIQYASRRKAQIGSFKSFKLDDIAHNTANVRKLSYAHITNNLSELPYLDFKTFALYNIMDVVAQQSIEAKTKDIDYIFTKCLVNNTTYNKGHRQTVYLVNRMIKEFDKKGFVIGNNQNKNNVRGEKFLGALVGDPLKTTDYPKIKIDGRPILVCDNAMDFDYKSLYPSIMIEFNIAPNTQIGRIDIPEKVYDDENAYNQDKYSRSGEFIENMMTDNDVEFCHRWLGLANVQEFLQDMDEYSNRNDIHPYYDRFVRINGKVVERPIYQYTEDVQEDDTSDIICPIIRFDTLGDNNIKPDAEEIMKGSMI